MQVAGSEFLARHKEALIRLVSELSRQFQYVSILGVDSWGKRYGVQKSGIQAEESRWTERGFVARVFNGRNYSEYSFNQLQPVEVMLNNIGAAVEQSLEKIAAAQVPVVSLPLIDEAGMERSYHGEVQILPEQMSVADKLTRLVAIKDQALSQSQWLVDFRTYYEEVQVNKIFVSERKRLEQSYVWSQGYVIPIVRRDERTKRAYGVFSGLKGPELLNEMAGAVTESIRLAESLLDAEPVTPGEYEVICTPRSPA